MRAAIKSRFTGNVGATSRVVAPAHASSSRCFSAFAEMKWTALINQRLPAFIYLRHACAAQPSVPGSHAPRGCTYGIGVCGLPYVTTISGRQNVVWKSMGLLTTTYLSNTSPQHNAAAACCAY